MLPKEYRANAEGGEDAFKALEDKFMKAKSEGADPREVEALGNELSTARLIAFERNRLRA